MKVLGLHFQTNSRWMHEHRADLGGLPITRWMFIRAQAEANRPRRILVVDDEEDVAWTIHDGLERLPNCEIAVAHSGERAWQLVEEQPFDLLVTDYKMPGMDGLTLSARVRQRYPQTAVILITAYSSEELRQQASRIAVRHVLDKPVTLAQVRAAALDALERPADGPA